MQKSQIETTEEAGSTIWFHLPDFVSVWNVSWCMWTQWRRDLWFLGISKCSKERWYNTDFKTFRNINWSMLNSSCVPDKTLYPTRLFSFKGTFEIWLTKSSFSFLVLKGAWGGSWHIPNVTAHRQQLVQRTPQTELSAAGWEDIIHDLAERVLRATSLQKAFLPMF